MREFRRKEHEKKLQQKKKADEELAEMQEDRDDEEVETLPEETKMDVAKTTNFLTRKALFPMFTSTPVSEVCTTSLGGSC